MSISAKNRVRALALAASIGVFGNTLFAGDAMGSKGSDAFNLTPQVTADEALPAAKAEDKNEITPKYLADAAGPNIHGFLSVPFKNAYVTPRGLVVENQGLVFQPVIGLIFPTGDMGFLKETAIITGIWTSFNTAQDDPKVGCWNEVDYFLTFAGKFGDGFNYALTYGAWFFPQSTEAKPDTEHNLDLKIGYADKWFDGFSINPYVDLWWAISGSSTVVLGEEGGTGYVELGIVPTKVIKLSGDTPVTFTFPMYISVGPSEYWDADGSFDAGCFGLFSISANMSIPLPIPVQYGHWHLDVGITYDYLINDALLAAGELLSGNDNRNVFIGSIGVGVNF